MRIASLTVVAILEVLSTCALSSTVTVADPQTGGIGYRYTITMSGLDAATFSNHVGAWSWEDNALFNESAGEAPVGWTHTSNWVALHVTTRSAFRIRVERDPNVPWPSSQEPNRLASTASMYPSYSIWRNWDNDLAPQEFADANNNGVPTDDWHTYNNRGAVAWAEDLVYQDHFANSTLEVIEREYILEPGDYSIVLGSNAPANDTSRQGYKATFTTTQVLADDAYFTSDAIDPLVVSVANGILANDAGIVAPVDVIVITAEPRLGTVSVNADGSFTYTPGAYFGVRGYDSFRYRVLLAGIAETPTSEATTVISTLGSAAGTHAGLIKNAATSEVAGIIKFDVSATGAWTSAVDFLGKRHAFAGRFELDGTSIPRGKSPPIPIAFRLVAKSDGERYLDAEIHGDPNNFSSRAAKSPFNPSNPPPSLGSHTVTLDVSSTTAPTPQKGGSGLLRIKPNGSAILSGTLGDRTPFFCSSALTVGGGPGPLIPVYASIYRAPGRLSGELTFGAAATSNASGVLTAVKPAGTKATKAGFTVTYDATTTKR